MNEPRKIKVRISSSDRPPRGPTIDSLLPSQNLTTSLLALIVSLLQSQPLNRALFHQRQGNLIRINSTQKDDGLVASVFNIQRLVLKKNEQK